MRFTRVFFFKDSAILGGFRKYQGASTGLIEAFQMVLGHFSRFLGRFRFQHVLVNLRSFRKLSSCFGEFYRLRRFQEVFNGVSWDLRGI